MVKPNVVGGYCFHGQILFSTWHRAYVNRLEDALRSIPGCDAVTIQFLDCCDKATKNSGLPETLTSKKFVLGAGEHKEETEVRSVEPSIQRWYRGSGDHLEP